MERVVMPVIGRGGVESVKVLIVYKGLDDQGDGRWQKWQCSGRGLGWGGQFEYICMESSANYICAKASIQVSAQQLRRTAVLGQTDSYTDRQTDRQIHTHTHIHTHKRAHTHRHTRAHTRTTHTFSDPDDPNTFSQWK